MKEDYQNALKKVTFFFLLNPVPFNRQIYQKQKRPGTSDQSLFRLRNNFRKISFLFMYYLTKFDDVIQSGFWVNSKNSICKFMQANLWHHKLFHFHLPFWIWKVWKGREKITKVWISQEQKKLFRWNKKKFHSFWRPIIWWKNTNLIKNSGHKL